MAHCLGLGQTIVAVGMCGRWDSPVLSVLEAEKEDGREAQSKMQTCPQFRLTC